MLRLHMVLHKAFEQATRWGVLPRNVVHLVEPPRRARREMTVLSVEQVRTLLEGQQADRWRRSSRSLSPRACAGPR